MKPSSPHFTVDLLGWAPLRWLAHRRLYPPLVQLVLLLLLGALALNGLGVGAGPDAPDLLTLRKTNLTTLLVWGLWWPLMIVGAVLAGRLWCQICPLELLHRTIDQVARRLGWPRRRLGTFFRAGWGIFLGYLVLQALVAGISLHRWPGAAAWMLVVLPGLAILVGLLFREPRAFCTGFCPVALQLSTYGRCSPWQLDVRDPAVCARCPTRDCVREDNRYRLAGRSCPSLIQPFLRDPADGCLVCLQCAKICPHDNVGFGLARPAAPSRRLDLLTGSEAAFVLVAAGFVVHELVTEVKWLDRLFVALPHLLAGQVPVPFKWLEAVWFLVLVPLLLFAPLAALARWRAPRLSFREVLHGLAAGVLPVLAFAHIGKALAKFTGWIGYLPLAAQDPRGLETSALLTAGSVASPPRLLSLSGVGWLMLPVLAAAAVWAWRRAGGFREEVRPVLRLGLVAGALVYGAVLIVWAVAPK